MSQSQSGEPRDSLDTASTVGPTSFKPMKNKMFFCGLSGNGQCLAESELAWQIEFAKDKEHAR
ncbi:MAG: hypothetical protein CL681_15430 [Blastopirellula sp.]|nr:hypothetical protein [Blastopirellula sp.]